MAGHSKFKNIMHRKGAQDAKRAKKFTKIIREILTAAKSGEPDPEFNPRLRTAINAAKAVNLPKDRIENAIKKANNPADGENFEEITYECYAPGGIALIITGLTDNRNRTASDVKAILSKHGATLAEPGSVTYSFERAGMIEIDNEKLSSDQMLESAIEAGAEDCETEGSIHTIYCKPQNFHDVHDFISKKVGTPTEAGLIWKPKNTVEVTSVEQATKLMTLIDLLEDSDDVQDVYGNHSIPEEIMKQMS